MATPISTRFADRRDAGQRLGRRLRHVNSRKNAIILALPRGGVPVAYEIAKAIHVPLDVFVVRKLGVPDHEELAMGAVASGGVRVLNDDVLSEFMINRDVLEAVTDRELAEVARREKIYRHGRAFPALKGRTVVLVDDGIATGATMLTAIRAVRLLGGDRIVVAAPVMADSTRRHLLAVADDVVCLESPETFFAVGIWYRDFSQTTDEEVVALLDESNRPANMPTDPPDAPEGEMRTIHLPVAGGELTGDLSVPSPAHGLVIFAHGSGSSRLSPRNKDVAAGLQAQGFATLLFDLLTPEEDGVDRLTAEFRFDITRLANRLVVVTDWVSQQEDLCDLPIGYFGASTGASAALRAAAARPELVRAVVSRGGRPDLAGPALADVRAPTLLIVGGLDREVLTLNRGARLRMRNATTELSIVPGATHLFEEPGALTDVMRLASSWFTAHLRAAVVASEQVTS